eukprot:1432281-Alexandrium_andersonii.AAC.1
MPITSPVRKRTVPTPKHSTWRPTALTRDLTCILQPLSQRWQVRNNLCYSVFLRRGMGCRFAGEWGVVLQEIQRDVFRETLNDTEMYCIAHQVLSTC